MWLVVGPVNAGRSPGKASRLQEKRTVPAIMDETGCLVVLDGWSGFNVRDDGRAATGVSRA